MRFTSARADAVEARNSRLTFLLGNREERRILLLHFRATATWTFHFAMLVVVQSEVEIEDFMTGVAEVFVLGHIRLPVEFLGKF
jgi:hypothetical protein